jgi:hypothetical protein
MHNLELEPELEPESEEGKDKLGFWPSRIFWFTLWPTLIGWPSDNLLLYTIFAIVCIGSLLYSLYRNYEM